MIEVPLTRGLVSLIDEIDNDLAGYKWHAHPIRHLHTSYYAQRNLPMIGGKRQHQSYLHRVILERVIGRSLAKGEQVDHINSDGLDNRRENLRLATMCENHRNRQKTSSPTTSRYIGVSWQRGAKRWRAAIGDSPRISLGKFRNEEVAARAYDHAAIEMYGKFAKLNFPDD